MAMTQNYMRRLNEEIGIAPANSQEEYQAAQVISSIMEEYDVEPAIEEFDTRSFSGLVPSIVALLVCVGVLVAGLGVGVVSVLGVLLALIPAIAAGLRLLGRDVMPSFGPRVRSQNVVGVHRACGPNVTKGSRTIVVVAHYDTPHENPLYSSALAPYLPTLARTSRISSLVTGLCAFVQLLAFIPAPARIVFWIAGILCSAPAVVLAVGAIAERMSPCTLGANDNKAAVAAMLGVLERVRSRHAEEDVPVDDGLGFEIDEVPDDSLTEPDGLEPEGAAVEGVLDQTAEPAPPMAQDDEATSFEEVVEDVPEPEPVVMVEEREEVIGRRHGAEVLASLGILPETCLLEYVEPAVRMVPAARPSVSAAPAPNLAARISRPAVEEEEPSYEESESHELVPRRASAPAPWQAILEKVREFIASKPWEALAEKVGQLRDKLMAARAQGAQHADEEAPAPIVDDQQPVAVQEDVAAQEDVQPTAPTAPLDVSQASVVADAEPAAQGTETQAAPSADEAPEPIADKASSVPHLSLVMDDEPRGVGPKDSSGLTMAEDLYDAEATNPNITVRPEPPTDPEWGKSSYRPQLSSVARRATLFDLPDPATAESDPFGSDAGKTRVQAPTPSAAPRTDSAEGLGKAVSPAPVSTLASDEDGARQRRARLSGFLDKLKKSDADGDGAGWLGDDGDGSNPTWRGGAAVREGLRLVEGEQPGEDELREAVLSLGDDDLIAHDIWFVALGASAFDHAGMKAFLAQHRSDIRGSFVVNLDCIGAGDLTILSHEGLEGTRRADRRLARLLTGVANDLHVAISQKSYDWTSTDATPAMRASRRAVTIMGLNENDLPALSRTPLDLPENVSGRQANNVAQIVAEMIRRS